MPTAATANTDTRQATSAAEDRTPLPLRGDTFLGVCEGIGRELGFNPNLLRVPLAALLLWNPVAIVGSYLALGCVLAVALWVFPDRNAVSAADAAGGDDRGEQDDEELRIAA
jgi:phage shock protein PspC (stress-responsive transcriptional regulator)